MYNLRNEFLNTTSSLLAPPNEGEEDTRSDAQKQRDSIEVTDNKQSNENADEENKENDEENKEDEDNGEEDEETEKEENDNKEKNKEVKEETEEEKTARLAKEKDDRAEARKQRKWDKLAAERDAEKRRADALEARLAEKTVDGLSEEEVDRRAEEKAKKVLQDKQAEEIQEQFKKDVTKLSVDGLKVDKNFVDNVNAMAEEIGKIPTVMIGILTDLDNENGAKVLNYLANNIEEAEEIYDLINRPERMTMKLIRLSDKIKEAEIAKPRQRSNVPAPITPITENSRKDNSSVITGKESMEDFVAKRNRQEEEKRKIRGY